MRRMLRNISVCMLALASCSVTNNPINKSLTGNSGNSNAGFASRSATGDEGLYVALAFSGGGMRASAFAYGMLKQLQATPVGKRSRDGVLNHVQLVSGVSGGSVTAAYYGLHGPKGLKSYRDTYLIQDAEKYMANSLFNPMTIVRGLSGGANGRKTFARFLDESIYHKATFGDLAKRGHATTWINASDVANNAPFLFSPETFDALCSDLSSLPVSEAVAASAAFPLVFAPVVLEAHGNACDYSEPDWLTAARHNPEATSAMRAYGKTLETYRNPGKVKFVKLLDGGITDNFGTTGLSVARAKAQNPYGPLSEAEAVKMRRMLFLVSNAGVEADFSWTQKIKGPGGAQLAMSIATSSMSAATRVGYDVMRLTLDQWAEDMIEYRCSLGPKDIVRLRGTIEDWDCQDLKIFVGEVSFDALDPARQDRLNQIPTRLKLETEQVDMAIQAGVDATKTNPEFNGFLKSVQGVDVSSESTEGARRITPNN